MFKVVLETFLVAMVPVIELRGAIPFGVVNGLSITTAFIVSVLGNLLLIPLEIIFIRRVFAWARTKSKKLNDLILKLEGRAEKNRPLVEKYKFWGLMILVAIPLPGTGAWTGGLVAAMTEMRIKKAMPAIALGVIMAGVIVTGITYGAGALL